MDNTPILIALGGNALILSGEKGYIEEQFIHTAACMKPIAKLISQGLKVILTHGNGPIVGNILLRNECAKNYIPPMPLYICVADSQGGIGAMTAESLNNELKKIGTNKTVSTVITHILVDKDDPAFQNPTKPIGPYYSAGDAGLYIKQGWNMKKIPERGWRRLVPSPKPKKIVELEAIKTLIERDIIPIASGGGGIPVIEEDGVIKGIDAVIDKDLSASLLARELSLKKFIILTDVDGVYLNWESDDRKKLEILTVKDAEKYLAGGHFPAGSMGPKIEAAIEFLKSGGQEVIISKPEDLIAAIAGKRGTKIVP
ncbi:MAG: carbamate kinase [Nitrospirae bacterium GWC2_46_6]|nr:MAG: carbamate kinase [Nitrospirae bacterium GWC2_46_6]OGW21240.1 MAG: carbamate kinase [Nitrospirae bacterium GWA2_46_11]OGW24625.1 MAG: carbamate kinase [Nitrospirae bacterium GWB2_47_37]HAK88054.1 carbamate kinase [Nitrospiraceae bacterium]HCL82244.1 carbamate kinase [Nitrospiraceae bacterium]